MEHFEIEDAFKRRATAHLDVSFEVQDAGTFEGQQGPLASVMVVFSLFNDSPVSARFPYLMTREGHSLQLDGFRNERRWSYVAKRGGWLCAQIGNDFVINPGMSRHMQFLRSDVLFRPEGSRKVVVRDSLGPLTFSVRFGCYDAAMNERVITLSPEDLLPGIEGGEFV
jgi:hypothetical protein